MMKFKKSEKGFTLIELLIVVAIIGILAAIAIPQFASYRVRAFNTAAQTDLRNFKTTMEADFADNSQYRTISAGEFTNSSAAAGAAGVLADYRTSANVKLFVDSGAAAYNAVAGHLQGDWAYGSSSGDAVIYRKAKASGADVAAGDVPDLPTTSTDTAGFVNDGWSAM